MAPDEIGAKGGEGTQKFPARGKIDFMGIESTVKCDHLGCGAERKTTNHWFVAYVDENGAHIYRWDKAPDEALKDGKCFCGVAHALLYASNALTPDTTDANRESTLELKPPLNREGTKPVEAKEVLETIPDSPEKTE